MKSKSWKLALTHFSQRYKSAQDIVDPLNYNTNKPKR
jgi:ribonuclease BN (tRNA processing enzyme)